MIYLLKDGKYCKDVMGLSVKVKKEFVVCVANQNNLQYGGYGCMTNKQLGMHTMSVS